jgi:hypothetical protein
MSQVHEAVERNHRVFLNNIEREKLRTQRAMDQVNDTMGEPSGKLQRLVSRLERHAERLRIYSELKN